MSKNTHPTSFSNEKAQRGFRLANVNNYSQLTNQIANYFQMNAF